MHPALRRGKLGASRRNIRCAGRLRSGLRSDADGEMSEMSYKDGDEHQAEHCTDVNSDSLRFISQGPTHKTYLPIAENLKAEKVLS